VSSDTWLGGSGSFQNSADWSLGHVPGSADTANITASGTYTVTSSANVSVAAVNTAAGATLYIAAGTFQTLSATGSSTNKGAIAVNDGATFEVAGTLTNSGTITLNSGNDGTYLVIDSPTVTLKGGGTVALSNDGANIIAAAAAGDTLDNVNDTISGSGQLGNGGLVLDNAGTIDANQGAGLFVNTGSNPVVNTGTIEDTGSGGLIINGAAISGGSIEALGGGSHVDLNNGTVSGGATLTTTGGAVIQVDNTGTLDGSASPLNNTGTVLVNDGTTLNLLGTINNTGTITLNSTNDGTNLILGSAKVLLEGGGAVVLSNDGSNYIYGASAKDLLDNVNETISGVGQLGNGQMKLTNAGTIDANRGNALFINTGASVVANSGTIEDTGTGGLIIDGSEISGGSIEALGGGSHVDLLNGGAIGGGATLTTTGGVIQVDNNGTLDGSGSKALNNTGVVQVNDGTSLSLLGAIDNAGTITLNSTNDATNLIVNSALVTLSGGGTVVLSNNGGNGIYAAAAVDVLDNVDNTISGSGQLGAGQLTLTNATGATIDANQGDALFINTGGSVVANSGLIEDTGTGGLIINGAEISGGSVEALGGGSHVDLLNGGAIGGGATLTTTGTAVIQVDNSGTLDGSASPLNNTGVVQVNDDTTLDLLGTIDNTGTITLNSGNDGTYLTVSATMVTLSGGGTVVLSNNLNNFIAAAVAGDTLDNVNNTIAGGGQIGNGGLTLLNAGTIDANQGAALIIDTGANVVINTGTIEDTAGSGLIIQSCAVSGGAIQALVAGSFVVLNAATIDGGTILATANGGIIETGTSGGTLDGSSTAVDNTGALLVNDGTTLALLGSIDNTGTITLNSGNDATNLIVNAAIVTLSGGGMVALSNNGANQIYGAAAVDVLDNVDNTISGAGQLGAGQLTLTNATGATIDANQGAQLVINTNGNVVTNSGTIEDTGTGGLVILNTNVSGGSIEALGGGAHVDLNNGTISGGATLTTTGGAVIQVDNTGALDGTTTLNNTGAVLVIDGATLNVLGTINNTGTITLNSGNDATNLIVNSATVMLSGGGMVALSNNGGNQIYGELAGDVLDNIDNTISGAGQLGAGQLTLTNAGTIDANQGGALVINTSGNVVTNTGTIEDTGTGGLVILNTYVSGGTINASGSGASIFLNGGAIGGGAILATAAGDVIQTIGGGGTLDGSNKALNNTGVVQVNDGTTLTLLGTIDNTGTITLNSTNDGTNLIVNAAIVTLSGGGMVALSNNGANQIYGALASDILDNVDNTISGSGQLGAGQLTLTNATGGTIDANQGAQLIINTNGNVVTNSGTIEDTGTGGLAILNTNVSGGSIEALGGGSHVDLNNGTISGGATLTTTGGAVIQVDNSGTLDGSASPLNNTGTVLVIDGTTLNLLGTINNTGTIILNSTNDGTNLILGSAKVLLEGGGTVVLSNNGNNFIYGASAGDVLDNVNNTISGAGQLGAGQMKLTNAGTIDANQGAALVINTGANVVTNSGTIEDTGTGGLVILGTNISGGAVEALGGGSHVDLNNGTISGGATLTTTGGAVIQVLNTGTLNGTGSKALNNTGTVLVNDATTLNLLGTIDNTGTIIVNSTNDATNLIVNSAMVTLKGGGSVVLSNNGANYVTGAAAGDILDNAGNTISGAGQFGHGQLTLVNAGTIDANQSNALYVNLGGAGMNAAGGVMEGSGSGGLVLQNGSYTNSGLIAALDGSFVTFQPGATDTNDSGGTLTGGTWEASANGHGATLSITGGAVVTDAATIILSGVGSVFQAGDGNSFTQIEQSLTNVAAKSALEVLANRNYVTANAMTVSGALDLGGGTFTAASLALSGSPTIYGYGKVTNNLLNPGLIEAAGGALDLTGTVDNNSRGRLTGGTWEANATAHSATLQITGGAILIDAATIILSGVGSVFESRSGGSFVQIEQSLTTVADNSALEVLANRNYTTTNAVTVDGALDLGGGTFSAGSLTIASSATIAGYGTVTDALTNPGSIAATGGTLDFTGADADADPISAASGATVEFDGKGDTLSGSISGAGTLAFGGAGTAAINGATIATTGLTLLGTAAVMLNENLSFSGMFTEGAGTTLTLGSGDALTLTGTSTIAGAIDSETPLTLGGGSVMLNAGASLGVSALTLSGGVTATVNGNLSYSGPLTQAGGTTISISLGDTLTLGGTSGLSGAVSGLGTLAVAAGTTTLNTGAALTVSSLTVSGTGVLGVGESLSYGGAFTQAAGTTVSIASGAALTFSGAATFAGKVIGLGALAFSGGAETINSGATFSVSTCSVNASAIVTVKEALYYANAFTAAAGSKIAVASGDLLSLSGSAALSGEIDGPGQLNTKKTTGIAGLTVGGTLAWYNYGMATETGGVTFGDASGAKATLTNESGAVYDITADVGMAQSAGGKGVFTNDGLLEKTAGTGTSAIGVSVTNSKTITVSSGTLELDGGVYGTGTMNVSGAAELALGGAVSATQAIAFGGSGGDLALSDTAGFKAGISGFGAGDTIDLTAFGYNAGSSESLIFKENANGKQGVLTIKDGAMSASIILFGQYVTAGFQKSADSGAGTAITYTPPPSQNVELAAVHH
jgi:hypothetical protein